MPPPASRARFSGGKRQTHKHITLTIHVMQKKAWSIRPSQLLPLLRGPVLMLTLSLLPLSAFQQLVCCIQPHRSALDPHVHQMNLVTQYCWNCSADIDSLMLTNCGKAKSFTTACQNVNVALCWRWQTFNRCVSLLPTDYWVWCVWLHINLLCCTTLAVMPLVIGNPTGCYDWTTKQIIQRDPEGEKKTLCTAREDPKFHLCQLYFPKPRFKTVRTVQFQIHTQYESACRCCSSALQADKWWAVFRAVCFFLADSSKVKHTSRVYHILHPIDYFTTLQCFMSIGVCRRSV